MSDGRVRRHKSPKRPQTIDSEGRLWFAETCFAMPRYALVGRDEELKLAADHFQRAAKIDQNFALGCVGLADAHRLTSQSSNDDLQIATQSVRRALQFDPTITQACVSLGDINGIHGAGERRKLISGEPLRSIPTMLEPTTRCFSGMSTIEQFR
jgi:hypothetical protein